MDNNNPGTSKFKKFPVKEDYYFKSPKCKRLHKRLHGPAKYTGLEQFANLVLEVDAKNPDQLLIHHSPKDSPEYPIGHRFNRDGFSVPMTEIEWVNYCLLNGISEPWKNKTNRSTQGVHSKDCSPEIKSKRKTKLRKSKENK